MPPLGSTPSKPASLTAFIFSITDPFKFTVPHMMAFLRERFTAGAGVWSAARSKQGVSATALPKVVRKLRREGFGDRMVFMFTSNGFLASFMRPKTIVKPAERCETTKQDLPMR